MVARAATGPDDPTQVSLPRPGGDRAPYLPALVERAGRASDGSAPTRRRAAETLKRGRYAMSRVIRLFAVASVLLAGPLLGQAAAAELKVLSAGAMRAVLQELAPEFEKSSGHSLAIEYATAGKVEQKVTADDGDRCRDPDQAAGRQAASASPSSSAAAPPRWRRRRSGLQSRRERRSRTSARSRRSRNRCSPPSRLPIPIRQAAAPAGFIWRR